MKYKDQTSSLVRVIGLPGAIMMGMGSIVGTGVFVSLGLAAGLTGSGMILSLFLASCLATCNGLSTAQLAAAHPISGGTYEYGYKFVGPWTGYLAGWFFICAKSASAATAAIGLGGYFLKTFHIPELAPWHFGLIAVVIIAGITCFGIKRSNTTNIVIVSVTLLSLSLYIFTLFPEVRTEQFLPLFDSATDKGFRLDAFLEATALMFVAYTGYGRIATLGEEMVSPEKNIPKAIVITILISFILYISVATVSMGVVGSEKFYDFTVRDIAPLQVIAISKNHPFVANLLSLGAMTAMLGVLLNLILGLSRVVLAMGRKNDLPRLFAKMSENNSPIIAVIVSGLIVISLVLIKDIKTTWSFSALTVLFYYAVTNVSALRLPKEQRLYPRAFAWVGLIGCLSLGFWVDRSALILGGGLLLLGLLWRLIYRSVLRSI